MIKKYLLLLTLILIKSSFIYCQSTDYIPKIYPADPSVQLFNKYIDQPVSLNTGLIDVSIPLYNFKEYGIEMPITLNYYTGGIKVDEIASEVGLGWTLRVGGSISRVVKANPDDSAIGYMYNTHTVQQARAGIGKTGKFESNDLQELESRDYEPDSFSFNFLNFSGKFFFDKEQNNFVQIPKTDIKINFNKDSSNKIISWVLTDDIGNKYYFGKSSDLSRTQVVKSVQSTQMTYADDGIYGGLSNIEDHIITWHLMEIKNIKGNVIKFYYNESGEYMDVSKISEDYLYNGYEYDSDLNEYVDKGTEYTFSYSKRRIKNVTLSKIETENQQVLFNQSTEDRLDLPLTKSLQNLVVLNKKKEQIKKIVFNYDYFNSTENTIDVNYAYPIDQYKHRLKLQSLSELDNLNVLISKHNFFYNESYVPNRTSNSQDAWGYYNGKTNTTLIPKFFLRKQFPNSKVANRDINEQLSKAFILTKIEFPTGGSVEYEYESNRAGLIENRNRNENFDTKEDRLVGFAPLVEPGGPEEGTNSNFENSYRQYFSIHNIYGLVKLNTNIENCGSVPSTDCHYSLKIVGIGNNFLLNVYGGIANVNIPNGDYYIEALKNGSHISSFGFDSVLTWEEYSISSEGGERVGGLRVKKTVTKDPNSQDIIKEFKYLNPNTSLTSGRLYQYPVFYEEPSLSDSSIGNFKLSSNSFNQTSLMGISPVTYEYVTELFPLTDYLGYNGKNEYIFATGFLNSQENQIIYNNLAVDKIERNIAWKEGKLLNEKKYSFKNDVFNLIEETDNEYETLDKKTIEYFGVLFDFKGYFKINFGVYIKFYRYTFYRLTTGRYKLIKSTHKSYFDSDHSVEQITDYQYNTDSDLLKKLTSTTSKLNETLETKYFYPPDLIGVEQTPYMQQLVDANRIAGSVITKTFNGSTKLSENHTKYGNSSSTGNLLLPTEVHTRKGTSDINITAIEDRKIQFTLYDTNGTIQEYKLENGTPVSVVWAYNKSQPIAKIENASYASITSSLITAAQTASDTGTEASLLTALSNLRNDSSLANAMITTYTYIPLVGVSTITDPKGDTITYTYDSFGRLQNVKDKNGNILSENEYHYKN